MLDKTFVDALALLTSKAESPKPFNLSDESAIVSVNGTLKEFAVPPPRRDHQAEGLETISWFASKNEKSSIWYNQNAVIVLADDDDRRDKMTMTLDDSPQFVMLREWGSKGQQGHVLSQREAILLLRTMFKSCLRNEPDLIANMRLMRGTVNGGSESKIEQGKRSIDKRLEHQWSGVASVPEVITFNVPVFDSRFHFEALIEVAIDSNPEKETFTFIPIPGSITAAIEDAERKIGETLRALLIDHPKIYYGSPTA